MEDRELEELLNDLESDRDFASEQDERRLIEKRRAKDLPFDLRPAPSATLSDLDPDFFRREYLPTSVAADVLDQNNRSIEQQLASLRFTTPPPDSIPTVLGLLTLGKDTRAFLPSAYIQFLRIDGVELTDPIKDQSEIGGPLPEMLKRLEDKLSAHISISADILSQAQELRHPDYPIAALQQLTRNAILHRNYEGTNAPVCSRPAGARSVLSAGTAEPRPQIARVARGVERESAKKSNAEFAASTRKNGACRLCHPATFHSLRSPGQGLRKLDRAHSSFLPARRAR